MSVYVDDMPLRVPGQKATLIADTRAELLVMLDALRISARKMKRQGKPGECVMLSVADRARAIDAGAIAVKASECASMIYRREDTGALGSPADADVWHLASMRAHAARMMGEGLNTVPRA